MNQLRYRPRNWARPLGSGETRGLELLFLIDGAFWVLVGVAVLLH
jgi:hypothetical protein